MTNPAGAITIDLLGLIGAGGGTGLLSALFGLYAGKRLTGDGNSPGPACPATMTIDRLVTEQQATTRAIRDLSEAQRRTNSTIERAVGFLEGAVGLHRPPQGS
jgi:hypothetical protein